MYSFNEFIREKPGTAQYKAMGELFLGLQNVQAIAGFFAKEDHTLSLMAAKPKYKSFYVPKSNGKKRLVEDPTKALKKIQRKLGNHLQGVYYQRKPNAAYGFIPVPEDESHPRNIYTNACRHIGKNWVLNLDFSDFFHKISNQHIRKLFVAPPFQFSKQAAKLLAGLTTYRKRLPMGAPTSPVLSNLVFLPLDLELEQLAASSAWSYTRYADDLTFSSQEPISQETIQEMKEWLHQKGFSVNESKVKIRHKDELPEVTGLVLKQDQPDVSEAFLEGIRQDIQLHQLLATDRVVQQGMFQLKAIKKLEQSIVGQINFVEFIRGEYDPTAIQLNLMMYPEKQHRGQSDWHF